MGRGHRERWLRQREKRFGGIPSLVVEQISNLQPEQVQMAGLRLYKMPAPLKTSSRRGKHP